MNCKGILRKTSPIKKRNISTNVENGKPNIENVRLIDHNHANGVNDSFGPFNDKGISKYQFSTINTTQKKQNKIQYLKNLTVKEATLADLSPRSKVVVAEKVKFCVKYLLNF